MLCFQGYSQPYFCNAVGPPSPRESVLPERLSQYCGCTNMSRQLEAFQGTFSHFTLELLYLRIVCIFLLFLFPTYTQPNCRISKVCVF